MTATLFPAFSRLADDRPRLARAYTSAQALTSAVALPVGVGVALIADPLVRLALGEKWLPVIFVIQALSWVFAVGTLGGLAQPLAMAVGQTQLLFNRDLQAFALRVPFIFLGMYLDGFAGIVYARVFTGTAGYLFNANVVTKVTGLSMRQQLSPNFRAFASAVIMASAVLPLSWLFKPTFNPWINSATIGCLILAGVAACLSATLVLWQLMGRPDGPEREVNSVLLKAAPRLFRRPSGQTGHP